MKSENLHITTLGESRAPVWIHVGQDAHTSQHSMHFAKLVVPLDDVIRVEFQGVEEEMDAPIMVSANVRHAMGSAGRFLAIFIPPEQEIGWRFHSHSQNGLQAIRGKAGRRAIQLAQHFCTASNRGDLQGWLTDLADIVPRGPRRILDRRVEEVRRRILDDPTSVPSLEILADGVDLSPHRLSHLFSTSVGLSLRQYRTMQRVVRGVSSLLQAPESSTIAEIALQSGFSDHAHFTRSVRKRVGQPPTYVRNTDVRIPAGNPRLSR